MSLPRIYHAEAIVLRQTELSEADRLYTLLTPDLGKLRAVARGVKKPKSRLAGSLQPLNHVALVLARGRSLDVITQAQVLSPLLGLHPTMERIAEGLYVAELAERFALEGVGQVPLFSLVRRALARLGTVKESALLLRAFEARLLAVAGYLPELERCVVCGQLPKDTLFFSPSGGGLLCAACRSLEPVVRPLSTSALHLLRALLRNERPRGVTRDALDEVEALLHQCLQVTLERDLRSAAFLSALHRQPTGPVALG